MPRRGLAGGSYTCTEQNFSGDCQWNQPSDRCRDDGGAPDQPNGVMSIGPDQGTYCDLYEKAGCTGTVIQNLRFPGNGSIMKDFGSFRCKAEVSA